MSIMAGRLSVFVAVVLVMCAEFPRSNGFQWSEPTKSSDDPNKPALIEVVYYPSNVSVTMKWKWTFSGKEAFSGVVLKRHKVNEDFAKAAQVASYVFDKNGPSASIESKYYSQQVNTDKEGHMIFTIKDVTKQTNNKDGGPVNVLAPDGDHVFTLELNAAFANPTQRTSAIKLIVNVKPKITTPPQSQYINKDKEVKLKCIATGKPLDVNNDITWEIKKYGEKVQKKKGKEITIPSFTRDDVGVYKCKVKNVYGEDTAEAFLQYSKCVTGCSSKELAVEMNKLDYEDGYDIVNSEKYKQLKKEIETECLRLYTKQSGPKIYSCVVTRFRKGSVVAVMKITYPSGTEDPDKPLREAIKTGRFAGYKVTTSFVSPTSPPTSKSTDEPTRTPGAGARGTSSGGLSTEAIVAIVVVFSIIFIVIIVVLIVCMVKRRKPAGSSKPYQEDSAYNKTPTAPLQSQPYKEDPYYNASYDRYPNGGGPPPQYTPSSNYSEVQPNQSEQDESQVDFGKSVKDEMWI